MLNCTKRSSGNKENFLSLSLENAECQLENLEVASQKAKILDEFILKAKIIFKVKREKSER